MWKTNLGMRRSYFFVCFVINVFLAVIVHLCVCVSVYCSLKQEHFISVGSKQIPEQPPGNHLGHHGNSWSWTPASLWSDLTRPSRFRKQRRANEGCGQVKLPAELLTYKHGIISTVIVFAEGIVHPKMKICCKCIHTQAIQDVDEFDFIRTDLEKFNITSLAHQWILCSEWVPSEWAQTADKNITIHITPVQQLMY